MTTNHFINYKSFQLPNGLKVILSPLEQTKAVTLLLLLPVGSRYENRQNNGVSHFIEHLFFKGTNKRPKTIDIAKELDAVGAEYNAFTYKDHTGYYIKLNADKLELAFDMLSDMLFDSKFDLAEIERERGVIVEEINMYEDNPLLLIGDLFESVVYPGSTLGWDIAGPRKVIRQIPPQAIKAYRDRFYATNRMVLSLAGKFDEASVRRLLNKYFAVNKPEPKVSYRPFKKPQTKPQLLVHFKATEQVQLCLGFPSWHYNDPRNITLSVLSAILGGNMSSRLFIEVRERRGLAYFVKTGASIYQDTGNFFIQAGLDKSRMAEAIQVIIQELISLKTLAVAAEELNKGKEFIKGKLILEFEDSEAVADWFGKQQMFKRRILTPKQIFAKIDRVNNRQIMAVARQLFQRKKLNLAVIGPFKRAEQFKRIIKHCEL